MIETRCDVCKGLIEKDPHHHLIIKHGKNIEQEMDLCVPCLRRLKCGEVQIVEAKLDT